MRAQLDLQKMNASPVLPLQTPVDLPPCPFRLTTESRIVLLGSCFAQYVGERLADVLPEGQVTVNPFGVLYNPRSVAAALSGGEEPLMRGSDGLWRSWRRSGLFAAPTEEALRAMLRPVPEDCDTVVVTFGTTRHYRLAESPETVVANCHREPAARFTETDDSVDALVAIWDGLMQRELAGRRVVFTVSPYRYAKYGLHASQICKAKLLLLVDELCSRHTTAVYFPAYEILLDELRDYRFYAPDMLHPSPQAADYIAARFARWAFSDELAAFAAEKQKLNAARAHRTLHPESAEAEICAKRLAEREKAFVAKWGKR